MVAYWRGGYLYKSERRKGRTITHYLGSGHAAELLSLLCAVESEERLAALADRRELERIESETFQAVRQRAARVDALATAGLESCGFWRPGRRCWRRRREIMGKTLEVSRNVFADLAKLGESVMLDALGYGNGALHSDLQDKLASLRAELAGPNPTPALRLAAEVCAINWLEFWSTLTAAAIARKKGSSDRLERRLRRTNARYERSLVAVERIRRLSQPRTPRVLVAVQNNVTTPPIEAAHRTPELVG
jgi:hypothetical protein